MLNSMPPIQRADARVLILGTMPGVVSLAQQQYYAHPRNAFWAVMAAVCGFDLPAPYETRCARVRAARIAVWDVLHSCQRHGSLDSNIRNERPNDLAAFFAAHPRIRRVLLNGGYAETLFKRHITAPPEIEVLRMPSTSPANARMTIEEKVAIWHAALRKQVNR